MSNSEAGYWNEFYGSRSAVPSVPSQFAVFAAGEVPEGATIVDIGCGTGRDSLFFASVGHNVLGIDGSTSAIDRCETTAHQRGLRNAKFLCSSVDASDLGERIAAAATDGPIVVYARFFLHAIDEETEAAFLGMVAGLKNFAMLAIEFRTDRDAQQAKVTPSHYRRFIPPVAFLVRAQAAGFAPQYFTEGFGFAKFKQDDAHVARVLLTREAAA